MCVGFGLATGLVADLHTPPRTSCLSCVCHVFLSSFSEQLVPAGCQVVPITNGKDAAPVNKCASATAEARVAAEQAQDEQGDEEQLLREPIVLSGTPYSYPVKVGKDVVSGKGGRVSVVKLCDCLNHGLFRRCSVLDISQIGLDFNLDRPNNTINIFGHSLRMPFLATMRR